MDLQYKLYNEILDICSKGDNLVEQSKYDEAIYMYLKALDLVPKPKNEWKTSTWIYTALGDTCYIKKDFIVSKKYLLDAIDCPEGIENPFINLRIGESFFELGKFKKAKEYLLKAYILDGYAIFYDENDKYFDLIKDEI